MFNIYISNTVTNHKKRSMKTLTNLASKKALIEATILVLALALIAYGSWWIITTGHMAQ